MKIDVSGAVKKLRSAGAAFDQRQALTEIGDSVLKRVRDGFATNGHHGKWKRMAPNTLVVATLARWCEPGNCAARSVAKSLAIASDEATAKGLAIDAVNKIVGRATKK